MVASIWSSNSDITLTCWRIIHFNFLLTAAIFASICFCRTFGLAFLLSLNFLFTRGYYISTPGWNSFNPGWDFSQDCNFFQVGIPSWNFKPGWKFPYNQPFRTHLKIYDSRKSSFLDIWLGSKYASEVVLVCLSLTLNRLCTLVYRFGKITDQKFMGNLSNFCCKN